MFLTGNSSLTPRECRDRNYHVRITCPRCRYTIGPAWNTPQWEPYLDELLLNMFPKLRCSRVVDGTRCGAAPVELTVERMTGKGSQMELVLKLTERLE